jgi:biopolymer transport protein ExbD
LVRHGASDATNVAMIDLLANLFLVATLLVHPLASSLALKSGAPEPADAATIDVVVMGSGVLVDGKGPIDARAIEQTIRRSVGTRPVRVVISAGANIAAEQAVLAAVVDAGAKSVSLAFAAVDQQETKP